MGRVGESASHLLKSCDGLEKLTLIAVFFETSKDVPLHAVSGTFEFVLVA
jgi:hypothetical protein